MTMAFFRETISSLSSSPLFCAIVTLFTLILLYFPSLLWDPLFSPLLISTSVLLFSLLHLGVAQRISRVDSESSFLSAEKTALLLRSSSVDGRIIPGKQLDSNSNPNPNFGPLSAEDFIEWDVRAPLEVIREEWGGEEEEEEALDEKRVAAIQRYASLSMYYPDSDSDSSSEGGAPVIGEPDSPETMCFWWEEVDKDELIEISLDGKRITSEPEEDNLIEIDLSPGR
ncbi:unnamed protein product [Cuscuta epithymum]|uniref:Uncharacterized protein n=1 Tax=Cuscuta epithymum TaxID=186058 RepID=A0AAV0CSB6_9ASTE|nr:unnamed protein product [Cuscuta epithymum]